MLTRNQRSERFTMKPRIRDIAAVANVSPATVSNALNGRPGVSKTVSDQILTLAREMGYEPAKPRVDNERQYVRLVIYKSHGMVVMDTEFFAELTESIQMECQNAGLELIISHINVKADANYKLRIREFCNEECAGILLLGTEMNAEELKLFNVCKSPLVVLDNLFPLEPFHTVVMNNYDAGYQATNALYAAGHRRIDHITSVVPFNNVHFRRKGYEEAMAAKGLSVSDANMWEVTPSIEGAYQDMQQMLKNADRPLPTAFFAANDLMAIGCIRALVEAGYHVPDDVSIIGMDDTAVCLACMPPLSTVRVHRKDLGIAAIRTLLHLAPAMHAGAVKTELSVDLIMRNSVKNLAAE